MPTIDVANSCFIIVILTQVSIRSREVSDAFISFAGLVTRGRTGHLAERIVNRLQSVAIADNFECDFNILREYFCRIEF